MEKTKKKNNRGLVSKKKTKNKKMKKIRERGVAPPLPKLETSLGSGGLRFGGGGVTPPLPLPKLVTSLGFGFAPLPPLPPSPPSPLPPSPGGPFFLFFLFWSFFKKKNGGFEFGEGGGRGGGGYYPLPPSPNPNPSAASSSIGCNNRSGVTENPSCFLFSRGQIFPVSMCIDAPESTTNYLEASSKIVPVVTKLLKVRGMWLCPFFEIMTLLFSTNPMIFLVTNVSSCALSSNFGAQGLRSVRFALLIISL